MDHGRRRVAGWLAAALTVTGLQLVTSDEVGAEVYPGITQLVSTAIDGSKMVPAVGPDISHDGRFVAFGQSSAVSPLWRKDRLTGELVLVSQSSGGVGANGQSYSVNLSPNGRYATFVSTATNLVTGDGNGLPDVFLRDIAASVTSRVSIGSDGTQPNGTSAQPAVSADGRYVAFHSDATNLVPGLTTSGLQVYVKDLVTGSLTQASTSPTGSPGNGDSSDVSISGDGTLLAFTSTATNLAPDPADPSPGAGDVFLFNRLSGAVTLLSDFQVDPEMRVTSGGLAELSTDGTAIAFVAGASASLLAYGSPTGSLSVLRNDGNLVIDPFDPAISANGNQIAFSSFTPLTPEAGSFASRQLYGFDRTTSSIRLVTIGTDGQPGNRETGHLQGSFAMSGDGRSVSFQTAASNLVAGDDPSSVDVLVRGPNVAVDPGTTTTTTATTTTSSSTSSTSTSSTTTSSTTSSTTVPQTTSPSVSKAIYLALGDSFPSGHGLRPYYDSADYCKRSLSSYPFIVGDTLANARLALPFSPTDHLACSGASTSNPSARFPTVVEQAIWARHRISEYAFGKTFQDGISAYVSVDGGINNFAFADLIAAGLHAYCDTSDQFAEWVRSQLAVVRNDYLGSSAADPTHVTGSSILGALTADDRTRVAVTGYYNPIQTNRSHPLLRLYALLSAGKSDCQRASDPDGRAMARAAWMLDQLNWTLQDVVAIANRLIPFHADGQPRIRFIQFEQIFRTNVSCVLSSSFVQPYGRQSLTSLLLDGQDCIHPSVSGAQIIGRLTYAALRSRGDNLLHVSPIRVLFPG